MPVQMPMAREGLQGGEAEAGFLDDVVEAGEAGFGEGGETDAGAGDGVGFGLVVIQGNLETLGDGGEPVGG